MIAEIGNIVIDKISDLPFIDKYAGVVRVAKYKAKDGSIKSFPVDCKATFAECEQGKRYFDLCPDNAKKSVIYLEDTGLRRVSMEGFITNWTAQLNLVGWFNLPKLGVTNCSYSGKAIQAILKRLTVKKFNDGNYHLIQINVQGQQPKTFNPFAKYSYDETVNQFLMYPFDYFVLTMDVNFRTDARCFEVADLESELNCVTK